MRSREREIYKPAFNNLPESPLRPEQPSPSIVILASESQRRKKAAQYLFPSANVKSIPGGKEPQTENMVLIVNKKLDHVLSQARHAIMESPQKQGIIIGADVKIFTLGIYEEPGVKDRGKPEDALQVREIFEEMYVASRVTEQDPYYLIRSSSAIVDFSQKREYRKSYSPDFTSVKLDPETIGYFSTQEGFDKYLKELDEFFSGQSYLNNGLKMPANIKDITGGLDLAVLTKLGAVKSISFQNSGDITPNDKNFAPVLKRAVFNSTVGFNPVMIKPYEPQVEAKIENWPWLEEVTSYAAS